MKLSQLGEFGIINRIQQVVDEPSGQVRLGIGDDCGIVQPHSGWELLITTDALVEEIHFNLSTMPFSSLGWKSLSVSISDIAAMAGLPLCCVVSLAIPERIRVENIEDFYKGLNRCAQNCGCPLIGGDITASKRGLFISVTVVGEVEINHAVTRSCAKPGDLICLTGKMGGSRTGREVLTQKKSKRQFSDSVMRFLEPEPKIEEARKLVQSFYITSMIDISDGLSSEIGHLCHESHVGCTIWKDRIPISEEAIRWAQISGRDIVQYGLESGEEYELLFTMDRKHMNKYENGIDPFNAMNVFVIGEVISEQEGMFLVSQGDRFPLKIKGWEHF